MRTHKQIWTWQNIVSKTHRFSDDVVEIGQPWLFAIEKIIYFIDKCVAQNRCKETFDERREENQFCFLTSKDAAVFFFITIKKSRKDIRSHVAHDFILQDWFCAQTNIFCTRFCNKQECVEQQLSSLDWSSTNRRSSLTVWTPELAELIKNLLSLSLLCRSHWHVRFSVNPWRLATASVFSDGRYLSFSATLL